MAVVIRSDTDIQRDILRELDWDPVVKRTDVGVEVDRGVVTLTGWVDSYNKKMIAELAAQRVKGVRAVANDISVKKHTTRTDTDIARAVAEAIESNSAVPRDRIEITVKNGKVTLQGEVDWDFERQAAIQTVHHIKGVRGMVNLITLKQPRVSPAELKNAIEQALIRNAEVDASRIDVTVDGPYVTLTGTVRSVAEKRAAEAAAWRANGVTEVINGIEVQPI